MTSPLDAVRFILTKIPLVIKTAVYHIFGFSPTSQKWDLQTALIVNIIRDVLGGSRLTTVTEQQQSTLKDPGVKGNIWVSRVTFPAPPEDALIHTISRSIRNLGPGDFAIPFLEPVSAEWTGYRAGVGAREPEPSISEAEKFGRLMEETTTDTTLLYIHGGSLYLMDPCSHREVVSNFAKLCGGRALSVRYRLAPQNPFPSALLDVFLAYLSLMYTDDSFHGPVQASNIIIGGDSAGGNLALALLQLLLQIQRDAPSGELPCVMFHGRPVPVLLPAGLALGSPSTDLTRSMQWSKHYAQYDYLPGPTLKPTASPPCAIWPVEPPRADLYCEGNALAHPLVSPLAAPSWQGSPPILIICGEERLTDECRAFGQLIASQGVTLVWEQYEAMPHCFPHLLQRIEASKRSLTSWAEFVKQVINSPGTTHSKGEFIVAKTLEVRTVDLSDLHDVKREEVMDGMRRAQEVTLRDFAMKSRPL